MARKKKAKKANHNAWLEMSKERIANGLCRRCGTKRGASSIYCDPCRARETAQTQALREKRRNEGVCIVGGCGQDAAADARDGMCPLHHDIAKANYRAWYEKNGDALNERRRNRGKKRDG